MAFPITRMRRNRKNEAIRSLVRETHLEVSQLVYPLFIAEGITEPQPISAMPGINQWPLKQLPKEIKRLSKLGIPAVLLFGIPAKKDDMGSEGYNPKGIIQNAIRAIKSTSSDMLVIADLCLCEYTSHGHCGPIKNNDVDNDLALELYMKTALSQREAGADIIAPSDMMDGRVNAIRTVLDNNGYQTTPIMAYSAKYSSGFYGPFREAAESAPQFGDRRTYQMDPANAREAMREIELDIEEGADIIMVKPALPYLDVIRMAKDRFDLPLAAYNVSAEYSMVKAAGMNGWIDEKRVTMEVLTGIRRAGADIIITYFAPQVAEWLQS
jgi:porphobilinogen synthase